MNRSRSKEVMASRYVTCPHCQGNIMLTGMVNVNVAEVILKFLQDSPEALTRAEIGESFPQYSKQSIANALMRLKQKDLVVNAPYGYWSAEKPEATDETG